MKLNGQNILGNSFSGRGKTFYAQNPATGTSLEPAFYEADNDETEEAIHKAHMGFSTYRKKSGADRALLLEAVADEIMALGDTLIARCVEETGLPEARLVGERGRTVTQLKLFAQVVREGSWVNARIDRADPLRKPLPRTDIRSMLRPLGPVGIFGASNFPLAFSVAGGDTASALAAGCTVVVKAHPAHPGTCELVGTAVMRAICRTNMPDGTFSMIHGHSNDVGLAIVRHPLIRAVGFTGSYRGGKAIFDEACRRAVPIPVYAEMGSTNPVFILPGAMKRYGETIAKDLAASITQGVGQFCTNPGLVLVEDSGELSNFKRRLATLIGDQPSGVMLTEAIKNNFQSGIQKLVTFGAAIASSGSPEGEGFRGGACLLEATARSFLADQTLEEEVFGPSSLMITARDRGELIQAAEKLSGHLTATIHATDEELIESGDLIDILEQKAGRLIINGYPTGVEVCHSMVHGGPFPATTDPCSTSVGTAAIYRFARPLCYQNFSANLLPEELKDGNPLNVWRLVNGEWDRE